MSHPASIQWECAPKEGDTYEARNERDPEGIIRMYEFKDGSWIIVGHREPDGTVNKPREGSYRFYQ